MRGPRVQGDPQSSLPFGEEAKPGFRTKTAATRLTPEELGEIEAAAEGAGQALSEWLRQTALRSARQRPNDPAELVLAEVWAVRYALLNLFHAASQAASEGGQLSPESFSRRANCLMTSSPAGERKELVCHECHAFSRKLFALNAVALASRDVPFATGCAQYVAEPVLT
jgi:hypothetical protein